MGKAPTITSKSSRFTPKTVSNIPSLPSLRHPESEMSSELSTPERLNSPSRLLLSHTRSSGAVCTVILDADEWDVTETTTIINFTKKIVENVAQKADCLLCFRTMD